MGQDISFEGGFTPESWDYSRAFAGSLGSLPSSFTSVIRLLMSDYDKDPNVLSQYGRFFAGRLLRSRSLQAPYFYAVKLLKPSKLPSEETPFEVDDFLQAFNGHEHAALLAIIFVQRHCAAICDPGLFKEVTNRLERDTTISWLIGNAIPAVGGGAGLLLGSFRILGWLPFLKHDPEGFGKYWEYLAHHSKAIDVEYEFQRWQCNSLQVAVMLGQQLGFGIRHVVPLMKALTTNSPLLTSEDREREFRVIDVWMDSVTKLRSAPAIPLPPKYYPNRSDLEFLLERSADVLESRDCRWLTRSKSDLTKELTPQLFVNIPEDRAPDEEGFPAEVVEEVGEDAINELSNKLLQEFLVDDQEN